MIVIEDKEQFISLVREAVREELKGNGIEADLLNVDEAAKYCGVVPGSIYNWVEKGLLKNRGTEGKFLFRESELRPLRKKKKAA